ncbi:MAG: hypothetical protein IT302_14855 [Dehalococcoidia bacterium]|nr:hypothetical protein [Dehalococcoidia bacterium]
MSSRQRRDAALAEARARTGEVAPLPAEGWPQALIDRTRALWESLEGRYGFWDHRFEVFASPVTPGAAVLIIDEHPTGDAAAFDLSRASAVPASHACIAGDGPHERRMRDAFGRAGYEATFAASVKMHANCFRSRDLAQWRTTNVPERQWMEKHSLDVLRTALERVGPRLILCEGMDTLQRVLKLFPGTGPTIVAVAGGSRRAYCRSRLANGATLTGIIAPGSSRTSDEDWDAALPELGRDLDALR